MSAITSGNGNLFTSRDCTTRPENDLMIVAFIRLTEFTRINMRSRHWFAFLSQVYIATSKTVICSSELFIVLEPLNRTIVIEKRASF